MVAPAAADCVGNENVSDDDATQQDLSQTKVLFGDDAIVIAIGGGGDAEFAAVSSKNQIQVEDRCSTQVHCEP